jgi:hypothetical protein
MVSQHDVKFAIQRKTLAPPVQKYSKSYTFDKSKTAIDNLINREVRNSRSERLGGVINQDSPSGFVQRNYQGPIVPETPSIGQRIENIGAAGLGLAGSAAFFAPALAAPVAAAGLGYGIYKAGEALKIW